MSDITSLAKCIRSAAEKATPGPWQQAHRKVYDAIHNEEWYRTEVFTSDGEPIAELAWYPKDEGNGVTGTYREDNAKYLALLHPDNVRALCDALSQRDAQIAALKADFISLDKQMSVLEQTGIADRDRAQKAEAQIAALTADNVAMKELISDYAKHKTAFDDFDGDRRGIAEHLYEAEQALLSDHETPATDAAANALRADGVKQFANQQRRIAIEQEKFGDYEFSRHCSISADEADEFAVAIRERNDG